MSLQRHRFARTALCAALALQAACFRWQPEPVLPRQFIEDHHPGQARFTLRDGAEIRREGAGKAIAPKHARADGRLPTVVLHRPAMLDGRVVGLLHARDSVSLDPHDVTEVARHTFSTGRTIAAVVVPVALFFGVACLAACGWGTVGPGSVPF